MKVIYNHASTPKYGIKLNVQYELSFIKKLFKDYKTFFKPVNGEWEAKLNKKLSVKKEISEEISIEK